jgi:hypothetical protein
MAGDDEDGEVECNAGAYKHPAKGRLTGRGNGAADHEVDRGASRHQSEVEPAVARTEEIVGGEDDGEPNEFRVGSGPVQEENDGYE